MAIAKVVALGACWAVHAWCLLASGGPKKLLFDPDCRPYLFTNVGVQLAATAVGVVRQAKSSGGHVRAAAF